MEGNLTNYSLLDLKIIILPYPKIRPYLDKVEQIFFFETEEVFQLTLIF
jgi:hypothetical protein